MAYGDPISKSDLKNRTATDLLARTIYGEAEGESEEGKRGVAWVVRNRVAYDGEWGSTYKDAILKGGFVGLSSSRGLSPDTSSDAWKVSLSIAKGIKDASTDDNPIGTCLWFNTNTYYNSVTKKNGGKYSFGGSKAYKVVEKVVIENHTFFRVEGYNL